MPERVNVLVVVESPPPGEKEDFFYNLSKGDRLRRNLRALLGLEMADEELPAWLKERGVFITDAIKCRPVKRALREVRLRVRMCLNCLFILKREVELLEPGRVVVMGETAQLASAFLGLKGVVVFPHPNRMMRFPREIRPVLGEALKRALGLFLPRSHKL